jgi:hypothetical protein
MLTRCFAMLRAGALAVVTPLLEKNPARTVVLGVPYVFSMPRATVLAFAIDVLRQMSQRRGAGLARGGP